MVLSIYVCHCTICKVVIRLCFAVGPTALGPVVTRTSVSVATTRTVSRFESVLHSTPASAPTTAGHTTGPSPSQGLNCGLRLAVHVTCSSSRLGNMFLIVPLLVRRAVAVASAVPAAGTCRVSLSRRRQYSSARPILTDLLKVLSEQQVSVNTEIRERHGRSVRTACKRSQGRAQQDSQSHNPSEPRLQQQRAPELPPLSLSQPQGAQGGAPRGARTASA